LGRCRALPRGRVITLTPALPSIGLYSRLACHARNRVATPSEPTLSQSRRIIARPLVDDRMLYPSEVVVQYEGEILQSVQLEIEGDFSDWEAIQQEGLFQCQPHILGPIFGGAFDPERELRFTVRLDPDWLPLASLLSPEPENLPLLLRELEEGSPLRQASSWKLISVMQASGPSVQVGLTTRFFDDLFSDPSTSG
jgi:hypothetical protein